MATEEAKRGPGRPKAEISLEELESLGEAGYTNRELAAYFGVSERTIENKLKKAEFRAALERGEANANISLRRKQLSLALAGDRTMLIWLGKQRLGQREKIDTDSKVTTVGPPPVIQVNFVKAKAEEGEEE